MSKNLDIEAVAAQSKFENVDDLAAYIARNTDAPNKKIARASGLPVQEIDRLMTSKPFRERLTEYLTYTELSPEKERKILRRMLDVAQDENAEFRDFRDAATWVYRQGGMLRSEKAGVDVSGSVRVAFTLDPSIAGEDGILDTYEAPDPFAGIVGLPGSTPEADVVDADFAPAGRTGSSNGETEGASETSGMEDE